MGEEPALVAERMGAALGAQVWSFGTAASGGCHAFLLLRGQAVLKAVHAADMDIPAPAAVWLPQPLRGSLQVKAGGEGYSAAISARFMQRIANDPLLAVHQQPMAGRPVILGPEQVGSRAAMLAAAFQALVDESRALEPGAAAAMGLHLGVLILHLWRSAGLLEAGARSPETTVQRFTSLVELHYREGLPVTAYARLLGVSHAHLHEACVRLAGRPPLLMIHARLAEEAQARLQQTELSVEQIGYSLGFRDAAYFNRFFKRLSGQPPGLFRKRHAGRKRPPTPSFAAWP